MVEEVLGVIAKWQSNERLTSLGEAMVQQVIVLPILRRLGWDPDNDHEVYPQYPVVDRWVDYALLIGDAPKVFIEVKKGGEPLEKHQEQLLDYSFKQGVKIAALTNGGTWWFYLPLREGSWAERKFHAAEFDKQKGIEIAQIFVHLFNKENVSSGKAVQNAEDLYKSHQIAETLPKAWNQLVKDTIANLLITRTKKLCGHKPSKSEVDQFLSKLRFPQITSPASVPEPILIPNPVPPTNSKPSDDVTGKKPVAFTFNKSRYEITTWRELLVRLCEVVHSAHKNRFEEILSFRGKGKTPFSRDASGMAASAQISDTGIFVETFGNAKAIVRRAEILIVKFGYNESDLSIETRAL